MKKLMFVITETVALIAILFAIYCWNKEIVVDFVVFCVLILFAVFCIIHTEKGEWAFQYVRGLYYKTKMAKCGKRFRVERNVRFLHPEKIQFGDNCDVAQSAVFAPLVNTRGGEYPSKIIIGDRVHIGAFDRIASMNEVRIDDDVLFAAFVHITDHSHDYHDIDNPIKKQGVISKGPVHICRGAWLAFGCHILSGVTIGENSVVAANAVVTKDVPPFSIVAGNPARIVKQYDHDIGKWKSIPKI